MSLPTREEINVHDSLDEQYACENFLGRTLEQAEALFRENALHYQEDLMFMGPVGFRYYVAAYVHYLESPESKGNSDAINCFAGLLEFRLKHEPEEVRPVAAMLKDACCSILLNWDRFDAREEIYGSLRARFEKLVQEL